MKRFSLAILFVLISATVTFSQVTYEAVTIAGASTALTAATYSRATSAMCRLETAEIRYTLDGSTAPTDTVGIPLEPFEWIILGSHFEIVNFRGIRTGASSGSLKCFYF